MKKFTVLLLALITTYFLARSFFLNNQKGNPSLNEVAQTNVISPTILPSATPAIQFSTPERLVIPKIQVDASVESVGLDPERKMDVPKHNEDVGWYNLGAKPGTIGNTVIDGHYDTVTGAPAVFYDLAKLSAGDTITVYDTNNHTVTYTVTDTEKYDFDKFPLQQVFGNSSKSHLNLITCGGIWDQVNHNYSKRVVVYADLAQ